MEYCGNALPVPELPLAPGMRCVLAKGHNGRHEATTADGECFCWWTDSEEQWAYMDLDTGEISWPNPIEERARIN